MLEGGVFWEAYGIYLNLDISVLNDKFCTDLYDKSGIHSNIPAYRVISQFDI